MVEEEFWKWLWGIRKVKAPQAWELGYTGKDIIVAVVDTGVDGTHPDLQGQLVEGYRPLTDETLDPATDSSFGGAHGTHVAGTIAAKRDETGVVGVAPDAKIMPIVIFEEDEYIGDDLVALGFLWAAEHGARIFSNSWGGKGYSINTRSDYRSHNDGVQRHLRCFRRKTATPTRSTIHPAILVS
jgi:subtilisin family serine protease